MFLPSRKCHTSTSLLKTIFGCLFVEHELIAHFSTESHSNSEQRLNYAENKNSQMKLYIQNYNDVEQSLSNLLLNQFTTN